MNFIYLVDNGLTDAADEIVAWAHTMGVRLTVFHSYSAFLDYRSVLSQAYDEEPPAYFSAALLFNRISRRFSSIFP